MNGAMYDGAQPILGNVMPVSVLDNQRTILIIHKIILADSTQANF